MHKKEKSETQGRSPKPEKVEAWKVFARRVGLEEWCWEPRVVGFRLRRSPKGECPKGGALQRGSSKGGGTKGRRIFDLLLSL